MRDPGVLVSFTTSSTVPTTPPLCIELSTQHVIHVVHVHTLIVQARTSRRVALHVTLHEMNMVFEPWHPCTSAPVNAHGVASPRKACKIS